ncbi:MAG: lyase family protein, partial [Candidatus Thorarchaeota archaeon]
SADLLAVGRSHGQHAVPITYGLRFAVWLDEIRRHLERIGEAKVRAIVGKIAGATGSHAALGIQGMEMQKRALTKLGLGVPIATTQIIQRDRHAETIMILANIAASIDKISTNLRNLQRTEIGETFEPFAKGKQVGSSAMPHKRNPVTCEKLCGIARYVRSLVAPALENVISWEERDITHSSTERFLIPQVFILVDYLLRELTRVIEGLELDENAIIRNLEFSKDAILSEYITTVLTRTGLERPKAHSTLREISVKAREQNKGLVELVNADADLKKLLGSESLDVEKYFDSIREVSRTIVNLSIKKSEETRKTATS